MKNFLKYIFLYSLTSSIQPYINHQEKKFAQILHCVHLNGYAKDTWNAYFAGQKILGASPASFQVLVNGYAKDNSYVYFMGQKVTGLSPYSFTGY